MIRVMEGLPDQVIGFEAVGEVEAADYKDVLDPAVETALASGDKLRLICVLGDEFTGFTAGAEWEDAKVGIRHWTAWEKIALVTDEKWVKDGINAFGWMVPGDVKTYPTSELDAARTWVTE